MRKLLSNTTLLASSAIALAFTAVSASAQTAADDADASASSGDIIVTAQKRSQSIKSVGMSINAASGEELAAKGVVEVSQLAKIAPGFNYNVTPYGTPVYTIRGVGFQDNGMGASPTVTVYTDEVPVAFSSQTLGAALDLERVEVLKGPQGTLFGGNSTGGAVNYIAAKPTSTFKAGVDASYGNFNAVDLSGFVSGPVGDTLKVRVAGRLLRSDAWQHSYTRSDSLGVVDQLIGRVLVDWNPTDRLKVSLNVNGWRDRSDSQAAQMIRYNPTSGHAPGDPNLPFFPPAPHSIQAADWDPGISFRRNNTFWQASGRLDYDLTDDLTFTSISSYQHFKRDQPIDADGTALPDFRVYLTGYAKTFFQEARLSANLGGGHFMLGGNYQKDEVNDVNTFFIPAANTSFLGNPKNESLQNVRSLSVFANGEYKLGERISLVGGIRYTDTRRSYVGCTRDYDGTIVASGFFPGAQLGQCVTLLNNFTLGQVHNNLNQDNVSWRVGLNYKPNSGTLLYANVSKGWKSGSFPTLSLAFEPQSNPVSQESVIAYEVGAKLTLTDRLGVNGSAYYYDYRDKQILGSSVFAIFGTLDLLVNIPKSRITGFELDATWHPIDGFTLHPSITLVSSKILGSFVNYDNLGIVQDFGGQVFPFTPKWSGNVDAEYRWSIGGGREAFIGGNANYRTKSYGNLGQNDLFLIKGYTVVDLRAGIEGDHWSASIWGRNVFDKNYSVSVGRLGDFLTRYTGRPATYGVRVGYKF